MPHFVDATHAFEFGGRRSVSTCPLLRQSRSTLPLVVVSSRKRSWHFLSTSCCASQFRRPHGSGGPRPIMRQRHWRRTSLLRLARYTSTFAQCCFLCELVAIEDLAKGYVSKGRISHTYLREGLENRQLKRVSPCRKISAQAESGRGCWCIS